MPENEIDVEGIKLDAAAHPPPLFSAAIRVDPNPRKGSRIISPRFVRSISASCSIAVGSQSDDVDLSARLIQARRHRDRSTSSCDGAAPVRLHDAHRPFSRDFGSDSKLRATALAKIFGVGSL